MKETNEPPIVENLFAAEVYADAAAFFALRADNVVSITLVSHRFDNSAAEGVLRPVTIARLVMPLAGAQGLALGLYDYLAKNGLAPPPRDPQDAN